MHSHRPAVFRCTAFFKCQAESMGGHRITAGRRVALAVWLGLCSPVNLAEIYEASQLRPPETPTDPAMAAFYTVNRDGESVPENPLESGFGVSSTGSYDLRRRAAKDEQSASWGDGRTVLLPVIIRSPVSIRIEPGAQYRKRSLDSRFDAFRCERHGFFYTSAGRCVIPAASRATPVHGARRLGHSRRVSKPVGRLFKD